MSAPPISKRTILVVEDDTVTSLELTRKLSSFGYLVLPVVSRAEDALRVVEDERPDLVMMDISLEGEVDGIEAAIRMRTKLDVPVLFLTASSDDESVDRARAADAYGYLIKPVKSVELRTAVELALERHRRERSIREGWFSAVLRNIGDGVIATGKDGRVSFLNPIAEALTGHAMAAASGRPIRDVFNLVGQAGAPLADAIDEALRATRPVRLAADASLVRRDGSTVPVEGSASNVVDDAGKSLGVVVAFRDVSERRQLQSNLIVADRMVSMGLLAAGVAHEVNNPLSAVMANVDLARRVLEGLRTDADSPPAVIEAWEALDDAHESAERIRRIVLDLRIFARSEEERRTRVRLESVLESSLRMANNEVRHRARAVRDYGGAPAVEASESRLGQVFLNLIVNAAQAIPEGHAEANEIRVSTRTDEEGRAVVEIRDTGAGIEPDVLERLFQPFFTTKSVGEGMGLGLALCRRIVSDLGGTLTIESKLGVGTLARIVLPAAGTSSGSVSAPAPAEAASPPSSTRGRVLIVDDDANVAKALARILRVRHDVDICLAAREALAKLQGGARFDVIFCDLMMPEMTGIELYTELQAAVPEQAAKIVFLTGGAFTARAREFIDRVQSRCLAKPFDSRYVVALVDTAVERAARARTTP